MAKNPDWQRPPPETRPFQPQLQAPRLALQALGLALVQPLALELVLLQVWLQPLGQRLRPRQALAVQALGQVQVQPLDQALGLQLALALLALEQVLGLALGLEKKLGRGQARGLGLALLKLALAVARRLALAALVHTMDQQARLQLAEELLE